MPNIRRRTTLFIFDKIKQGQRRYLQKTPSFFDPTKDGKNEGDGLKQFFSKPFNFTKI